MALSTLAIGTGANGFQVIGVAATNHKDGTAVAAGDINGDGITDLIIGAPGATNDIGNTSGSTYVVYGKSTSWPASFSLVNVKLSPTAPNPPGFRLDGINNGDLFGSALHMGCDMNGDGIPDLIIGAPGYSSTGAAYIAFGTSTGWTSSTWSVSNLTGTNGFVANGTNPGDLAGTSVAFGDINGVGKCAAIIGAPGVSTGAGAGAVYTLMGASSWTSPFNLSGLR